MYFFDSFFYPFNSQGLFNRILIALLLTLIPIFGTLILTGYGIKIIHEIYQENKDLPPFEWGADLRRGVLAVVATLVYLLPTLIVTGLLSAVAVQPDGSFNFALPLVALPLALVSLLSVVAALVRYGVADDPNLLFQVGKNVSLVAGNPVAGILFFVNLLLYGVFVFVAASIGTALFIIPGLIILIAAQFGVYFLYAQYGYELEIGGKTKYTVDDSYTY